MRLAAAIGLVAALVSARAEADGLSVADLGTKGTGKPARAGVGEGRKVAPKYRNSATGETWTGRGLQPKWIKEALASGRSLEDLAI